LTDKKLLKDENTPGLDKDIGRKNKKVVEPEVEAKN
jgi:hypothetical protein